MANQDASSLDNENHLIAERRAKLAARRERAAEQGKSAFPNDFRRDSLTVELHNLLGENTIASSLSSEYGNVTGSALAQPVRVQHLHLGLALPADRRVRPPPPCSAPSPTTSQRRP